MSRLLRILPVTFLLISISAFADSITFKNLNANLHINPNDGTGENAGGTISGPDISLRVFAAGTLYNWFNGIEGYLPGSTGGGGTPLFIGYDRVFGTIGSQSYEVGDILLKNTFLDANSFIFPTNGEPFTITLPASIEVIAGSILVNCSNTCDTLALGIRPGTLTLSFSYSPETGRYYGSSGSFTSGSLTTIPEPSTLGLVGIGVGAVIWRKYKSLRFPIQPFGSTSFDFQNSRRKLSH